MDASKEFLKEQGIMPKISFKDGLVHTIKLINDKKDTITTPEGEEKPGLRYLVEEDGEKKIIITASISLISKLSSIEKGSMVKVKMISTKGSDGKYRSSYVVDKEIDNAPKQDNEEVPVIEEGDELFNIDDIE